LQEIGSWLNVNGEAIYASNKWSTVNEGNVYYTVANETLYAIVTGAYPTPSLVLAEPITTQETVVTLVGYGQVSWMQTEAGVVIQPPILTIDELPCRYAYTFALTNVKNL
jgi:alpha-L-fucosidase